MWVWWANGQSRGGGDPRSSCPAFSAPPPAALCFPVRGSDLPGGRRKWGRRRGRALAGAPPALLWRGKNVQDSIQQCWGSRPQDGQCDQPPLGVLYCPPIASTPKAHLLLTPTPKIKSNLIFFPDLFNIQHFNWKRILSPPDMHTSTLTTINNFLYLKEKFFYFSL